MPTLRSAEELYIYIYIYIEHVLIHVHPYWVR
jgi:hypothetical protein